MGPAFDSVKSYSRQEKMYFLYTCPTLILRLQTVLAQAVYGKQAIEIIYIRARQRTMQRACADERILSD